jgi:hypothetical protein
MFYDFNSLIEFNNWGGYVSITDTTFDTISNCGSLIRNYYKFYDKDNFNIIPI